MQQGAIVCSLWFFFFLLYAWFHVIINLLCFSSFSSFILVCNIPRLLTLENWYQVVDIFTKHCILKIVCICTHVYINLDQSMLTIIFSSICFCFTVTFCHVFFSSCYQIERSWDTEILHPTTTIKTNHLHNTRCKSSPTSIAEKPTQIEGV